MQKFVVRNEAKLSLAYPNGYMLLWQCQVFLSLSFQQVSIGFSIRIIICLSFLSSNLSLSQISYALSLVWHSYRLWACISLPYPYAEGVHTNLLVDVVNRITRTDAFFQKNAILYVGMARVRSFGIFIKI